MRPRFQEYWPKQLRRCCLPVAKFKEEEGALVRFLTPKPGHPAVELCCWTIESNEKSSSQESIVLQLRESFMLSNLLISSCINTSIIMR